jgi:hypothetical protein
VRWFNKQILLTALGRHFKKMTPRAAAHQPRRNSGAVAAVAKSSVALLFNLTCNFDTAIYFNAGVVQMTKRVGGKRRGQAAAAAPKKKGTGEREATWAKLSRGLQRGGAEDGVDGKGVGRGCGADKANNPRTKRAGGGCERDVGGGREFQTRGGAEATHGAGQDGAERRGKQQSREKTGHEAA